MTPARETIYAALFARLSAAAGFQVAERRVRHWEEVAQEDMPYLGMVQNTESPAKVTNQPYVWRLMVDVYIYVRTNAQMDKSVVPDQVLNPILDAVEAALAPQASDVGYLDERNTLGDLVYSCKIAGTIETSGGMLGDLEYAMFPIEIVVPS